MPQNLIDFMVGEGLSYQALFGEKKLRFTEETILPGEIVYILGAARKRLAREESFAASEIDADYPGELGDIAIARSETEKIFIISDKSQKQLVNSFNWWVILGIFGGPILSVCCIWYLLVRFKVI